MKQPERVTELLAELRALTENDFERHRIDVLERYLTAPPTVEVIDNTHQRFDGVIYAKRASGHYGRHTSIHRAVWYYYNGKIPEETNIHHIDCNPANNSISNLQLLTIAEHAGIHHSKNIEEKICPICGNTFNPRKQNQTFCSIPCSAKHISQTAKKSPVEKTCPVCGKSFSLRYQNYKQLCCSPSCSKKYQWANDVYDVNIEKICPICGKNFVTRSKRGIYCSKKCSNKANEQRRRAKKN
ncbi:MAG: HNH endonuclease [Selenomonadaceae bacterium]|nr:HNH endonuclease [Selenomonadaceae bacterium]